MQTATFALERARATGERPPGDRTQWRDPKRFLWLLASAVPGLALICWLGAALTGVTLFWWTGPILAFLIVPVLDRIVGQDAQNPPDSALAWLDTDPFYRWVTFLYIPGQYLSLAFACWLWSGGGWLTMTFVDRLGLAVSVGIIGGVGISTAHELGHRRAQLERVLSKVALAQTGYGHFFVGHNRGHHKLVATPDDPASARLGESLYQFICRSSVGSLRSAWRLETKRLARVGKSRWSLHNDVLNSWLISIVLGLVLVTWFGIVVLPWLVAQAIVGFCLLEAVNYIEHYGLRRRKRGGRRYERVSPKHSWNSNTVIANVFLFHLQRHSDHHAHPSRRFQSLRHADEAPQLPAGYSTMMVLAMIPPLWHRVMDHRVIALYGGDASLANHG